MDGRGAGGDSTATPLWDVPIPPSNASEVGGRGVICAEGKFGWVGSGQPRPPPFHTLLGGWAAGSRTPLPFTPCWVGGQRAAVPPSLPHPVGWVGSGQPCPPPFHTLLGGWAAGSHAPPLHTLLICLIPTCRRSRRHTLRLQRAARSAGACWTRSPCSPGGMGASRAWLGCLTMR